MKTTYIDNISNEIIEKNRATIKKFLTTNKAFAPCQDSCPDITVYWQQKANGKAFHLLEGKYEIVPSAMGQVLTTGEYRKRIANHYNTSNVENNHIVVCAGKDAKVAYAKYYPEFEMLEFGVMTINIRKIPEEKRNYFFVNRYFLFGNCPAPFDVNGNIAFESKGGKFYSLGLVDYLNHDLHKAIVHSYFSNAVEEFTKRECSPKVRWTKWTPYTFSDYYKMMYPRTVSKSSVYISELVNSLPIINLDKLRKEFPKKAVDVKNSWNNEYHTEYQDTIWTFNILSDSYCVIRQFGGYFQFAEQTRILIDSKGKVTTFEPAPLLEGDTVFRISSSVKAGLPNDRVCHFKGFKDVFKFKRLFYISSIIIEQFYKAGYKYIANHLMSATAKSDIKWLFGFEKYSETVNIYELSGMNKHQLKLVDEMFEEKRKNPNNPTIIYTGLYFVGTDNFVYTCCKDRSRINKDKWCYMDRMRHTQPATSEQTERDRKNLLKLIRLQERTNKKGLNEDVFRIFLDALNLFKQISNTNRPDIDLYSCKDVNELHRYHNMLIEINIIDKEERTKEEQERLNKLAAKLYDQRKEKFEYADDNFSIIVPEEMNKITKEGVYLHHCVGGYVNRVAEGRTNILFLRKNDDIEIPFFTIEVSNSNEIIQIHGLYNRWLGNEPEAVKFVINWIREKGIRCPVNIILNKGQGYSASSSKLDAKEYDLEGKKYV